MKEFFRQLIKYNRMYRLALLIGCWAISGDLTLGLILFFLALPGLNGPFRNYLLAIRRGYYQRKKREQARKDKLLEKSARNQLILEQIRWYRFKNWLKNWPYFLLSWVLPYISRLPVFEDYFRGNLYHYRNRKLLAFKRGLDRADKQPGIDITDIDLDSYHVTFGFKIYRPLTPTKAEKVIYRAIRRNWGGVPEGVFVQMKRSNGQILIPRELIR